MEYFRISSQYEERGKNGWGIDWSEFSDKDIRKAGIKDKIDRYKKKVWTYLTSIPYENKEVKFGYSRGNDGRIFLVECG